MTSNLNVDFFWLAARRRKKEKMTETTENEKPERFRGNEKP